MFRSAFVIMLISAIPASAADPARAASRVKEVIGHRGSAADRPENTLAGIRRAIEAKAHVAEVDVRTTRDGVLICMHDPDVDRTTNGKGRIADLSLRELKLLDAGSKFNAQFAGERIPTLREVFELSQGKITVMLDLKEDGDRYIERIAADVRQHGEPDRLVIGVRSVEAAGRFRKLFPKARQIGLIPTEREIEAFAQAGVEVIRLWPKWLADDTLVQRVRMAKCELNIGTGRGTKAEVLPLLVHQPESLSSDDPMQLMTTLTEIAKSE